MIYLVAILTVFFGGLVGHAPVHGRVYCRMIAFIIPVCLCVGLLNLPQLLDVVRTGFRRSISRSHRTGARWSLCFSFSPAF